MEPVHVNKWSVERLVAPDEYLSAPSKVAVVVAFELACLAAGLWLILRLAARSCR